MPAECTAMVPPGLLIDHASKNVTPHTASSSKSEIFFGIFNKFRDREFPLSCTTHFLRGYVTSFIG